MSFELQGNDNTDINFFKIILWFFIRRTVKGSFNFNCCLNHGITKECEAICHSLVMAGGSFLSQWHHHQFCSASLVAALDHKQRLVQMA